MNSYTYFISRFSIKGGFSQYCADEVVPETMEKNPDFREKTREKILNAIRKNPNITTSELADIAGITIKGVEYQIQQ